LESKKPKDWPWLSDPVDPRFRFFNLAGFLGRFLLVWLKRHYEQMAFGGRLFLMGLFGSERQKGRRRIMNRLLLREVWLLFATTGWIMILTGLMAGFLWDAIWFGVLDNIAGAESLISLAFSIQLQEVAPILASTVVTMGHGVPMTVDLALRKSQGEFMTLKSMGIPPEHFWAWPRLLAGLIGFPVLFAVMAVSTLAGLYIGIWDSIELPLGDYLAGAKTALVDFNFIKMGAKFILVGFCLNFFCLFHSWRIKEGNLRAIPRCARWAMAETFIFCTLGVVLVTVLYD
jgi:phospholipid/cholesterol/gamma-HCH transport system permease protein